MSLEEEIHYLTAAIQSLEIVVSGLTTAMQTLTATARTEIEVKHGKPMIEVLKFGTDERIRAYEEHFTEEFRNSGNPGKQRKPRAKEQFPRAICRASCCGAEHHRYSPKRDGCGACKP